MECSLLYTKFLRNSLRSKAGYVATPAMDINIRAPTSQETVYFVGGAFLDNFRGWS